MSDDELIEQLESPARWWWSDHPKGECKIVSLAPQEAAARIREQRELLDECEALMDALRQEIQNLGGSSEGVITADATLAKLRAQERG